MATFKEKSKTAFTAYFWDGTLLGFSALPVEILEWCAFIKGSLIHAHINPGMPMGVKSETKPVWLVFDPLFGIIETKDAEKIEGEFDEIDETGNVKPKPNPNPISEKI